MPFDGKELFHHWTMCRFKSIGGMGTWVTLVGSGRTELVDQRCVRREPFEGENPCPRCGWKGEVIKVEEANV